MYTWDVQDALEEALKGSQKVKITLSSLTGNCAGVLMGMIRHELILVNEDDRKALDNYQSSSQNTHLIITIRLSAQFNDMYWRITFAREMDPALAKIEVVAA